MDNASSRRQRLITEISVQDVRYLLMSQGGSRGSENEAGHCHCSWLPTVTRQKNTVSEDKVHSDCSKWRNHNGTDPKISSLWIPFVVLEVDTQDTVGETSSAVLSTRVHWMVCYPFATQDVPTDATVAQRLWEQPAAFFLVWSLLCRSEWIHVWNGKLGEKSMAGEVLEPRVWEEPATGV